MKNLVTAILIFVFFLNTNAQNNNDKKATETTQFSDEVLIKKFPGFTNHYLTVMVLKFIMPKEEKANH
jgi:hypothetical protein